MKTTWKMLGSALTAALAAVAALTLVAAAGPALGWWHYEVVESGSMRPTLAVGGVAVVEREPATALRAGQILIFQPPGANFVRIHRVIALTHERGQIWVRTKGDANNTADPGPLRLLGKNAYVERFFVPYIGYFAVWLYKGSTRLGLEIAFVVLMMAGGLYLIWGGNKRQAGAKAAPGSLGPAANAPRPRHFLVTKQRTAQKAATASLLALNNMYEPAVGQGEAQNEQSQAEAGQSAS